MLRGEKLCRYERCDVCGNKHGESNEKNWGGKNAERFRWRGIQEHPGDESTRVSTAKIHG